MADRRAHLLSVAFVTLIMVVASFGLLAAFGAASAPHGGLASSSAGPTVASAAHAGPSTPRADAALPSAVNPSGLTATQNPVAVQALAQARAVGVPARDVFVPRAGATPSQAALAQAQGHVTPLYGQNSPAPLGLAYYGLSAAPNGSIVATVLNSPSVFASFDANATGVIPNYPFSSSTDAYGIQLNAVSTSINLLGNGTYSFWTQDVAEYYPLLGTLYLVTNVWNFTGPALSTNAIASHGPYGQQVGTTFYYAEKVLTGVSYPFNLDLWMNNSVNSLGQNNVSFAVGLAQGAGFANYTSYPYDWVNFNSTNATLSQYSANGEVLNQFGLTNDFEVILGGPGGGAQADLFAADANMSLQYWNSTTGSYQSVPAAYSYGGETGETVTGAYVGWASNNTTGQPYGVVRTGPGFLYGLWNATGSAGLTPVQVNVSPSNAFIFLAINQSNNFSYEGELYWAPQELNGGQFYLAPGAYNFTSVLSGYDPVNFGFVVGNVPETLTITMVANATIGIYTPLYVWNNNQYAGISTAGNGTPGNPYLIMNTQTFLMGSIFGFFNDYTFPVYQSVFFWGTNASVEMANMPSMTTAMPYLYFPTTNDLGYLLEGTSNVALVNSTQISGWFTTNVNYPFTSVGFPFIGNFYGTFSVQTWNATNTLIAGDTFLTQAAGLSMQGGTANTVWGNTFTMAPQPVFSSVVTGAGINPLNLSLGLQSTEGGDLVYNNIFDTTTTAAGVPINLYSGAYTPYVSTWNITPTPASTVNYAAGFAWYPLTGTIIGNATQGGNFWWDYGSASNPFGVLPYNEYNAGLGIGQIYVGGDYYPLVYQNYSVAFAETGLTSGTTWSVTFAGTTYSSNTGAITLSAYNGSYAYSVPAVGGLLATPASGTVVVAGIGVNVTVVFAPPPTYAVTFTETGLPSGTQWGVGIAAQTPTSTTPTITLNLQNGSYPYTVNTVTGYSPTPSSGTVTVAGAAQGVSVTYSPPPTYAVTFTESGLPSATNWSVTFNGVLGYATTSTIVFTVPNNAYLFSVGAVSGYTASPASGTVTVSGAATGVSVSFTAVGPAMYTLSFTETGLPSGTSWSVAITGGATLSGSTATLTTTVANGTYAYTVGAISGYTQSPATGSAIVSGSAQSVSVTFSAIPTTFTVTFAETGLPSGTSWSVTLNGTTHTSTSDLITFVVPNGKYTFSIGTPSGYGATVSATSPLTVTGTAVDVAVVFGQNSSTSGSSGLSTLDWILIGVVIAIIIIGLVAALAMRGRGGSGTKSGGTTESKTGSSSSTSEEGSSEGTGGGSQ